MKMVITRIAPQSRLLLVLLGVSVLVACSRSVVVETAPSTDPTTMIIATLQASTDAWNRGDLEGFLEPYLDSPQTTFAGSSGVTRGKDAIRSTYQSSYWKSGTPAEALRFDEIEVRPLGADHALAVGRYVVSDRVSGAQTATGLFSLVLVRTPQGWKILHDHSS
jgi:uncharacterized protein (TIGR02246 family)